MEEPRIIVQVVGKSVPFLINSGASWSIFLGYSDDTYSSQISVVGVDTHPHMPRAMGLLLCSLWGHLIAHSFLITLLGRDIMVQSYFPFSNNSLWNFPLLPVPLFTDTSPYPYHSQYHSSLKQTNFRA